jgi:uncharacterized protein YjlB
MVAETAHREDRMNANVESFNFEPEGGIPNHRLPLLVYRGALPPALQSPGACQALFARNEWGGNWVNGVFDYWHFHVTGHEVLGCVAGEAEIGFGGDSGIRTTFRAGDVAAIPAGVGHKRLSEKRGGFTVVGGYPPGQSGAISRPGELTVEEAQHLIGDLGLPRGAPVSGPEGAMIDAWGLR